MIKKNELIETLNQGGYIYMDDQSRRAIVYSASEERLDSCRYDTAENLRRLDEYEAVSLGAWSFARRIENPEARQAALEAAARELSSIRTPGTIELVAKNDCWIGQHYVAKGRHYCVTVYGDGTQKQPGNAYGTLHDFRTAQHAIYFEIVSRPETAQELAAQSERVYEAVSADLARAGMLAQDDTQSAQEAPEMVNVSDLIDDLNTGDNGDALNDYRDSSAYICDAIAEIADNRTSIYYSDILDFIRENPLALADVIAEGLYDPTHDYDLYKHGQAAEYMLIERDIYDHLADSLMVAALDFIRYDLKRPQIPAELADLIREWCDDADNNDRMNDIPDRIREYFEEEDEE